MFYSHRRGESRPVDEVVETKSRLIDEGRIDGYGFSEVSPGTLRRANAVRRCTSVQNDYPLWARQTDLRLIQTCAELEAAFVSFAPLARGASGRRIIDPASFAPSDFRQTIPRIQGMDWQLNRAQIAACAASWG